MTHEKCICAECEGLRKDAERYRWLRSQYWKDSNLCVVCRPNVMVKLGAMCPSGSLLDRFVDLEIEQVKP